MTPPTRSIRALAGLLAAFALLAATGAPAVAADAPPAALQVRGAWVRWLPAGLPAAGYLTLVNPTGNDRYLTGAASPDYAAVALHESYATAGGEEGMRPVARIRIPAHGEVRLAPGGFHLMLMQARRAIAPGDTVTIELKFDDGRSLPVSAPVKPAGQRD